MQVTKINLTREPDFFKVIYPLYPSLFLFSQKFENFRFQIEANFDLSPEQWQKIETEWQRIQTLKYTT